MKSRNLNEIKIYKRLKKNIRSGITKKPLVRLQGMLALVSFVFSILSTSLFFLPNTLYAQDPIIPIGLTGGGATGNPTLQLENYDAAGMEAFFQDANAQAGDVDSWIALVVNNVGMQRAAWESDADMQIQAYIDNLNVSDNYNGVANYRDALLKELNSQKEAALQIWERTANTDIYLQLENYLTNLTGGIYDDAVGNTDSSLSNTNGISQNTRLTPEQIQQQFNQSRQQWETQFEDSTEKGLREYGDSLTAINDNYNRFVDQLDSADVNFQQNLQAIQDYKQNVISGISSTVDNLKGFLDNPANESLFGTSSSRLPAGTELQALIDKFTTKIASMGTNDFSLILTQLASDMTSYLDKQVNLTTVTRNTMASKVDVRSMNNIPNGNPDMLHWSETDRGGVPPNYWADPQDNLTDGYKQIKAYRDVIDANGNRTATENDLINYVKNRWYKGQDNLSFKIIDANMFAYSKVAPGQPYWGTWGMNQNYAENKNGFWWFGAYKPGGADQFRQETFGFKIDYMVHDKDMETNTITFTGFVNQLSAQFSNWQNNLIPAISNWESQAANYKNFYDQWKGNADTLRANAKTEYEASVAKVESDRSKWLLAMETEKKDADEQWEALASKIDTSNMTGRDLSALLSQTPSTNGIAVNSPNALADNFNTSLQNLQNTKFTFNSTDYRDEIAGYTAGAKPAGAIFDLPDLRKFTALQTVKSFLTDPFSTQSSYSIFNPEIKAPDTSVTGINLDKAFTNSFNGVQNMAYVTGTTDAADKIAKDYYDSIVNQYKFNFKKEVLDARREAALDHFMQVEFNLNKSQTEDALAGIVTLKGNVNVKKARGDYLAKLSDIDLLTPEERDAYTKNKCYTNISICSSFMEENKDLKSITVENGQIVITREISDGTIHKGSEPVEKGGTDYNLVGGYSSGKQKDVIRVNMAKMGVIIQNPKDLFTEWSNEDYNAIADNLNKKANELYASAEKDSKAITSEITDSVKRGDHFMSIAMGAAQSAVAQDQMVQSIAQAYFTGGMAGIQQMVKDKIRDAFLDKVAEATGLNPDLVRFASGRFEQAKLTKKMNSQASKIGTGVGVMASLALGPVGPLMMAGPMGGALLGAGAGGKLGSSLSGGTMRSILNNPVTDAALTMSAGVSGAMMGGPAGLVAGVAAKNKFMKSNSVVSNNNQYNALQQQENALIQDAAGAAVANAIGRPDAAGNFSQILGGLKKRQVAKRDNANLGKVASSGVASALNMANGMVKGIVRNAVIAVGGKPDTFDQLTANPFTPPATWTGAAKVDMSKEGLMNRAQEMAYVKFLENNGMDTGLANIVASGMNGKIKAAKAKKEEKTKAIESTAQTAISIAAMAVTGGAATPLLTALNTTKTVAQAVVTATSIAAQAAIGSRTGGTSGALAGALNGILQSAGGAMLSKAGTAMGMTSESIEAIKKAETYLRGVNVSYSKKDGFGVKANVTAAVQGLGTSLGFGDADKMKALFTNVTIGQSQRGGATFSLGTNLGFGTIGVNYTGATGTFGGSYDVIERDFNGVKFSSELNYDGKEGLSISGNADFGNGLGLGLENGRNGTTGSLTILGSQQGTVDVNGNYTANENFLGEINGQDMADLADTVERRRLAEENERNPAKNAKDAKDAPTKQPEEGPSGLVDVGAALFTGGLAALTAYGARLMAGGGSSSAAPNAPAGNGDNAVEATEEDRKKKVAADLEKSLKIKQEIEQRKRQAGYTPDIEVEGLANATSNNTASDVERGYPKKDSLPAPQFETLTHEDSSLVSTVWDWGKTKLGFNNPDNFDDAMSLIKSGDKATRDKAEQWIKANTKENSVDRVVFDIYQHNASKDGSNILIQKQFDEKMKILSKGHDIEAERQYQTQLNTGKNEFSMTPYEKETLREFFGKTVDQVKIENISIGKNKKEIDAYYDAGQPLHAQANRDSLTIKNYTAGIGGENYQARDEQFQINGKLISDNERKALMLEGRAETLAHEFFHFIQNLSEERMNRELENLAKKFPSLKDYKTNGFIQSLIIDRYYGRNNGGFIDTSTKPAKVDQSAIANYRKISAKEWIKNPDIEFFQGYPVSSESNAEAFSKRYYEESFKRYRK